MYSNSSKNNFPSKLVMLLEDAINEGNEHIVSWLPHGKAFNIHKPIQFEATIMKRYFAQSKYRSFLRQLYHYGFGKIDFGPDKGAFFHPDFQRDDRTLSISIQRNKSTKLSPSLPVRDKSKSSPEYDWLGAWVDRQVSISEHDSMIVDIEPRPFPDIPNELFHV